MARLVPPSPEIIERAARLLHDGDVVAFPTETVYGLGALTHSERGLDAIFATKGRPSDNPLIAHVLDEAGASALARQWDDRCAALAEQYWPGPLTIVVPRAAGIPSRAVAGLDTIAIRAPRHSVARALLTAADAPISAPSANRSGAISPTSARHVADDYDGISSLLVIDGGPCEVGLESTVVDLTVPQGRLLRPGSITESDLRTILPDLETARVTTQDASPGTRSRHYAPSTPTELVETEALLVRVMDRSESLVVLCFDHAFVPPPHRTIVMPEGAGMYARRLYNALRDADAMRAERILIQQPPTSNDVWKAVHDRLARATSS